MSSSVRFKCAVCSFTDALFPPPRIIRNYYCLSQMLQWLPIDLIVEIGILAGPDEYEQIAQSSKRNAIILQKTYIIRVTNELIVKVTNKDYDAFYYQNELHSFNDQPAIIYANGTMKWYQHGKYHRDNDLPATIYSDGGKMWYQHGELHRDNDLPVVIYSDGSKWWCQHGEMHRDIKTNFIVSTIYQR
jgi:hypothetical protein